MTIMKKTHYIFSLVLLGSMVLTGCDKYLTPDNKTNANQTADKYFSNDPSSLRVYAYSKMKDVVSDLSLYEDGVDLFLAANKKAASDYDQYTFNTEDSKVKNLYTACYSVINYANCCIFYDANMAYNAEMRFLRNFCYYVLTQHFGGVPYITSYINDANRNYPRTDLMTLYDNIIADLNAIKEDGALAVTSTDGHASKMACYALLSKVALAAGWDAERAGKNGDKYFTASAEAAKYVRTTMGEELTLDFEEKWSPSNETNAEVIFAVQYDRASWKGDTKSSGHGYQNTFGSYYGDCTATGLKYSNSFRVLNAKGAYLWTFNDKRWNGTFMTTMYNAHAAAWSTEGYYAYYNNPMADTLGIAGAYFPGTATTTDVNKYTTEHATQLKKGTYANTAYVIHLTYPEISYSADGGAATKVAYNLFINTGPLSGMYTAPSCKKFDDPNTDCIALSQANDYRDIVLLHLSDIYLVEAEAQLKLNQESEALTLINKVRTRAGVESIADFASYQPAWKALLPYQNYTLSAIDLILDERARELFGEGHRWMDLHRTGKLIEYNKVFNDLLKGQTPKMYRPIPQAEINANEAISENEQNEEWGGKWTNK